MINLQNLKPSQSRFRPKRVGRGNASGKGTTAGRGTKGQRARTGGRKQLVRRGLKALTGRTPKVRGFTSRRQKLWIVTLDQIERTFKDGSEIRIEQIVAAGLIPSRKPGVKVLSGGELKKKFTIRATRFSAGAVEQIRKAGGQALAADTKSEPVKS